MNIKKIGLASLTLLMFVFPNCGENDDQLSLIGVWRANSVVREDCTNENLNGIVNCIHDVGSGNTHSCVNLTLEETGYTLTVTFDANTTNEVGNYETSEGQIRLCPTQPIGTCYNLPIISSSFDNMTIKIPRDGGCIATIELVKT